MSATTSTKRSAEGADRLGKTIEISRPGPDGQMTVRCGSELWLSGAAELDAVREVTRVKGQRWCLLWALPGKTRTVERTELADGGRRARMRHGAPCGSGRCPNCARRMRLEKSVQVEAVLNRLMKTPLYYIDDNGEMWDCSATAMPVTRHLYMLTLTARHERSDSLAVTLRTLETAFRGLWSGRTGQRTRIAGLRLVLKSLEVTYGDHGWHPHLHVIVAAAPVPGLPRDWFSPMSYGAEFDRMKAGWLRSVGLTEAVERGRVEEGVAFSVEEVAASSVRDLSDYVSSLSGARSAALETTRLDLKRSRKGNVSVWELPRKLAETRRGNSALAKVGSREMAHRELAELWREWEATMRGVHQLAFAPGWQEFMPSEDDVDERVQELREAAETASEWVAVYEPDERECALIARFGLAPVLAAAAGDGTAGVALVLAEYERRAEAARSRRTAGFRGGEHATEATTDNERATPPGGASEAEGGAAGAAERALNSPHEVFDAAMREARRWA